ncbi:glycosyltransferase family 4 protein [Paenarthrobacter nicotinovorans]|uniref:glycosyltransferase family 4 protein n=1 Tax=Paenarthrobacter nicotinovorans TaxID=29320 RepID=UPI001AE3084E
MRIGLIVGPWFTVPPEKYGGTERVVDALARALVDAGHEVLLAAASDSTCPVPRIPGFGPSQPDELGLTLSELDHVIKAYRGLGGVDIIHDHTLAGPLYAYRPPAIPVVTTIHGQFTAQSAELYRAMERDTSIIAISNDQRSMFPDLNVAAVIHHGLDLSTVSMGDGLGGYACFVGRMCQDKGLMEAVAVAREAGVPLKIAAKMHAKDEQDFFREVVKPALGPQEEFLGELSDPEKYELMGGAVALINPIQWPEPFGLVMIESLATGTPVVATPMGAAPEIVKHGKTGFLGEVRDLAGFLDTAARLSRTECRRSVDEYFSAGRMAAEHLALYSRILQQFSSKGLPDGGYVEENQRQAS